MSWCPMCGLTYPTTEELTRHIGGGTHPAYQVDAYLKGQLLADPPEDAPLSVEQARRDVLDRMWQHCEFPASGDDPADEDALERFEQAIAAAAVTPLIARMVRMQVYIHNWGPDSGHMNLYEACPHLDCTTTRGLAKAAGSGSIP